MSKDKINAMFATYKREHGQEPLYAECLIQWSDHNIEAEVVIKLDNSGEIEDDQIFYFAGSLSGLIGLHKDDREDFRVVDVYRMRRYCEESTEDIINNFQPKATKFDGSSVLIEDENSDTKLWMDVDRIEDGLIHCEWNQYIFDPYNTKDIATKHIQDSVDVFEKAISVAAPYFLEQIS